MLIEYDKQAEIILDKKVKKNIERNITKNFPNEDKVIIKVEGDKVNIYDSSKYKIEYYYLENLIPQKEEI